MDSPLPLVCKGRPVDDTGRPVGEPCGRTYQAWPRPAERLPDDRGWNLLGRTREATAAEQADEARAAGWSPDGPMCPKCRKPDPAIARGLTRPAPADRTNPKEL